MEKLVFMDRDGTLNREVHYLHRPEDLELFEDVPEGLKRLKECGFQLVVVTNQAGVARGYYSEEEVKRLHAYMNKVLEKQGTRIDRFFYCPHHPEHGIGIYKKECGCRKPKTGMFAEAEQFYKIDKAHSYMIGDKLIDTQAGKNYGVCPVLVGTGYGEEVSRKVDRGEEEKNYEFYGKSFKEAVDWILKREGFE